MVLNDFSDDEVEKVRRLFEWVRDLQALGDGGSLELTDKKGRKHRYRWANNVPLNGSIDADNVNFFEYELIPKGKVTYRNSWVTDIPVDEHNVFDLVKGGRARWKIENETFNTLKNQGDHFEHSYGHGNNHLSVVFMLLMMLAFLVDQTQQLACSLFQAVLKKEGSRLIIKDYESFRSEFS